MIQLCRATTPNPNLAVALHAQDTSALGVTLTIDFTGLTAGTVHLEIQWGDETTYATTDSSTTVPLTYQHSYGYSGTETITVTVDDGSGDTATNSVGVQTLGSEFTAFGPWRMLDTRKGIGAAAAPVAAHGTLKLKVAGVGVSDGSQKSSTPVGVTAVVLNVTATGGTANGVLTVYGDEDRSGKASARPGTSNVNYAKNQNVPNLVVVPVGKNGLIDFYNNSSGSTGIVADIQGYFTDSPGAAYFPVTPTRIIDTRKGIGTGKIAQIPANGTIYVTVAGLKGGVIPFDAAAVALNLTAVDATHAGVITAYSSDGTGPVPAASNLDYAAGRTSANAAIVRVSFESPTIGQIAVHNSGSGPVDIIADASGYFTGTGIPEPTGGSAYVPLPTPIRILDTRKAGGPIQTGVPTQEPFPSTSSTLPTAAIFNATVTQPTGNGYLSLYPYNGSMPITLPATSNLNYSAGQTIPNLAFVTPAANGGYGIYLGGRGSAQVIVDWFGYFQNQ